MTKLNPEVVAHDIANIFCNAYVSAQSVSNLDSVDTQKHAAVIYASAYDTAVDYVSKENLLDET